MAIFPPWHIFSSISRNASGEPDISRPTSKPSRIPRRFWTSRRRVVRESTVTGMPAFSASFRRCGFTSVITTWRAPANRATTAAMMPIGPGARDQHVLAEHGKRKRSMHRISEGIENRGDLARDGARVLPHVHHRQDHVFGERARAVHSHALRVRAQVTPPGQAIAAAPANHVPFPADEIAGVQVRDVRADFDDLSAEFVPDDERHVNRGARPIVPVVDVQVGAANARAQHANLDVVDAGFGLGNIFEPQASRVAALNEGFHPGFPNIRRSRLRSLIASSWSARFEAVSPCLQRSSPERAHIN